MKLRNHKCVDVSTQNATLNVLATPGKSVTQPQMHRPETFHPFPKLPIELRQMIWKLTLKPRIVELQLSPNDRCFFSQARTPTGLRICRDSRDAILPFYPARFGSNFKPARIRFNYELDTLYFDQDFSPFVFHFLDILKTKDVAEIRYIALNETLGFDSDDDDAHEIFWHQLEKCMKRFKRMKSCLVVLGLEYEVNITLADEFYSDQSKPIEFFDNIPQDLLKRPELGLLNDSRKYFHYTSEWKRPRARLVWGWRRTQYSAIV
jgi:hypothetical protein